MVFDFKKKSKPTAPVILKGQPVERVSQYKYLGVTLDDKLTWKPNTNALIKKTNSRLFFLRKLRSFDLDKSLLKVFYSCAVHSVLTFGAVCWGGCLSKFDENRIQKCIKQAGHIVGEKLEPFENFFQRCLVAKVRDIVDDNTHPMSVAINSYKLPSGRFALPLIRTERHRQSFIPRAIVAINGGHRRGDTTPEPP